MKIYAIWKLEKADQVTPEAEYADSLIKAGMDTKKEQKLLEDRIKTTTKGKLDKTPIQQKPYDEDSALSYHSFVKFAFLKGACLIIGDDEFAKLPEEARTILVRNILTPGRQLSEVIADPLKYSNTYHHIFQANQLTPTVGQQRLFKDNALSQAVQQKSIVSCLFKGCF